MYHVVCPNMHHGEVHWNPMTLEIVVGLSGSGMLHVVCPSTIDETKCKNLRFRVEEGDVFVVPRYHPMAQMSFNNGSFVFVGFTTTQKNNHPQYLAGSASVFQVFDRRMLAASLGVSNTTMDETLLAQKDGVILECVSCAEEEQRLMEEEIQNEKEERGKKKKRRKLVKRKKEEAKREQEAEAKRQEEAAARQRKEEAAKMGQEEEAARQQEEKAVERWQEEEAATGGGRGRQATGGVRQEAAGKGSRETSGGGGQEVVGGGGRQTTRGGSSSQEEARGGGR